MVSLAAETVVNADGRARMLNPMLIKIRIEDELRQKKFKDISSKKFAVLLPFNVDRRRFMDDVARIFREEGAAVKPVRDHSLGGVYVGDYVIFAKPEGRQLSTAVYNTSMLINNVNQYIGGGKLNIEFNGGGTIFKVPSVVQVRGAGRRPGMGPKADVHLVTDGPKGTVPVSLIVDNEDKWEDVDSWYPGLGGQILLDDAQRYQRVNVVQVGAKSQMQDERSRAKLSVARRASKQQAEMVVFGSDIMPKGAVVFKTLSGTDFEVSDDGGTLKINVTRIIDSKRSLKKDEVWFLLTNASSRAGGIRPGIRAEAVTARRSSRSGIRKA